MKKPRKHKKQKRQKIKVLYLVERVRFSGVGSPTHVRRVSTFHVTSNPRSDEILLESVSYTDYGDARLRLSVRQGALCKERGLILDGRIKTTRHGQLAECWLDPVPVLFKEIDALPRAA